MLRRFVAVDTRGFAKRCSLIDFSALKISNKSSILTPAAVISFNTPLYKALTTSATSASEHAKHKQEKAKQVDMPESFMTRAREKGTKSLIGPFYCSENRFDRVFKDSLIIDSISDKGDVEATLIIKETVQNSYRSLHGGATASVVDIIGTICFLGVDNTKPGVSLDISVSYPSAAAAEEKVSIKGRVLKMGKRIGFSEVVLYGKDGKVVASGRHTKAFA